MKIKPGQPAPGFTLYDTNKQQVSLEQYKGRNVVLLFFPLAFTGVCTTELCSVRDGLEEYQKLNTDVLAISVDSIFTLGKFKEEQKLNFPLLSDFNKEVAGAYGALYESFVFGMKGVAKRSAFVIDKDGVVVYAEVLEEAKNLPNFEAIKQILEQLK